MDKMAVYNRLPVFAQNWACSVEGARIARTRFGSLFRRTLQDYEARSRWSSERIAAYRDERLRAMVKYCYDTVPYYRAMFDEGGRPGIHQKPRRHGQASLANKKRGEREPGTVLLDGLPWQENQAPYQRYHWFRLCLLYKPRGDL